LLLRIDPRSFDFGGYAAFAQDDTGCNAPSQAPKPGAQSIMTRFGAVAFGILLTGAALPSAAQNFGFGRNGGNYIQSPFLPNVKYDGRFTFARLSYNNPSYESHYYRGLPAWAHGYDLAERNLMQILNTLSTTHPRLESGVVMALDDPELFKYPLSYMTEAGFWSLTDKEAAMFRKYLMKGGFVIFDDFRDDGRGGGGYANFLANMQRIVPNPRIVDLTPKDPIFHSFFDINDFNVLKNAYDRGNNGHPILQGIYDENDPSKRLVAMINYSTDVSQFWEYNGQGLRPMDGANEGYKMGINYLMYAMAH